MWRAHFYVYNECEDVIVPTKHLPQQFLLLIFPRTYLLARTPTSYLQVSWAGGGFPRKHLFCKRALPSFCGVPSPITVMSLLWIFRYSEDFPLGFMVKPDIGGVQVAAGSWAERALRKLKRGKKIDKHCAVMETDLCSDYAVFSRFCFMKPLFIQYISKCLKQIYSKLRQNWLSSGWYSTPWESKILLSKTNKTTILWNRAEQFPLMQESWIKFPGLQYTEGQKRCL